MSYRNMGRGKRRHTPIRTRSIYGEKPAHPTIAAEVDQSSIPAARESVDRLEKDFRNAKTRPAKVRRLRAAQLEANRLKETLNRSDLHADTRARLETEAGIFERSSDRMQRELGEK